MGRKFDIVTDSACDMPWEYYEKNNVECVKLGFTMNNVNYEGEGGEKITEKEFYQKLREGAMPTTYQVTGEMARKAIERCLQKGNDVLVVTFSSGLSGTAGSFLVAARDLAAEYPERNIRVVDSLSASMGEGLLLYYAVQRADLGATLDETADYLEELKSHIVHLFTVDNLFHLKRGGRVSGATALVGTILKIKPVMHVDDEGRLVAIGKTIGRKKALNTLVEKVVETATLQSEDPIFISHGDCMDDVEYVQGLLKQRFPKTPVWVNYVGSVIGTHSGCGTLAIFYKGTHR